MREKCPHCGELRVYADEYAGLPVSCKACGKWFSLPEEITLVLEKKKGEADGEEESGSAEEGEGGEG